MRWLCLVFMLALAGIVVAGGAASVSSSGGVDVVDEATLGERSNQTVCDDEGLRCVDGVLENSAWRCSGVNASTFSCNVSFWLNLTVRGPNLCASGGINVTDELAPEACTSSVEPFTHEVGGPVTLTFDAGEESRLVNVSGEVCVWDGSESEVCGGWDHDPILLPSWEQWDSEHPGFGVRPGVDHQICLGDLEGWFAPGDVGPGCVSVETHTRADCAGPPGDRHCIVTLDAWVMTHGLGLCASLDSEYGGGLWEVACSFRQDSDGSSWEELTVTQRYEPDEVPFEGRTAVVEIELCGWVFRPSAERYCEVFNKTVRIPGHLCACGPTLERTIAAVERKVNYVVATVNHEEPPGVYP